MAEKLHWEDRYPIAVICDVIGLAQSSYYHQPAGPDDKALKQAIPKVLAEFPTGLWRFLFVVTALAVQRGSSG